MPTDHQPLWHRSTFCGTGACVEVAKTPSTAFVRDAKAPDEGRLTMPAPAWKAFITAVTDGTISSGSI